MFSHDDKGIPLVVTFAFTVQALLSERVRPRAPVAIETGNAIHELCDFASNVFNRDEPKSDQAHGDVRAPTEELEW